MAKMEYDYTDAAVEYFTKDMTAEEKEFLNLLNTDVMYGPVYILTNSDNEPVNESGQKVNTIAELVEVEWQFSEGEYEGLQPTSLVDLANFDELVAPLLATLENIHDTWFMEWDDPNPDCILTKEPDGYETYECEDCGGTGEEIVSEDAEADGEVRYKDGNTAYFKHCTCCGGEGVVHSEYYYYIVTKRDVLLKLAYADVLHILGIHF